MDSHSVRLSSLTVSWDEVRVKETRGYAWWSVSQTTIHPKGYELGSLGYYTCIGYRRRIFVKMIWNFVLREWTGNENWSEKMADCPSRLWQQQVVYFKSDCHQCGLQISHLISMHWLHFNDHYECPFHAEKFLLLNTPRGRNRKSIGWRFWRSPKTTVA